MRWFVEPDGDMRVVQMDLRDGRNATASRALSARSPGRSGAPTARSPPLEARLHLELGQRPGAGRARRGPTPWSRVEFIERGRGDRARSSRTRASRPSGRARSTTPAGSAAWIGWTASSKKRRTYEHDENYRGGRGRLSSSAASAFGAEPAAADPAWDKLKTLVGEWKGTYAGSRRGAARARSGSPTSSSPTARASWRPWRAATTRAWSRSTTRTATASSPPTTAPSATSPGWRLRGSRPTAGL